MSYTLKSNHPDFEDCSTNYFDKEQHVKAGNQLQKDAWNAAIQRVIDVVNEKGLIQVEIFKELFIGDPTKQK